MKLANDVPIKIRAPKSFVTLGEHLSDDTDTAIIGDLAVQLVSVAPYPHSEQPIDPQSYQITLTWEKRQ